MSRGRRHRRFPRDRHGKSECCCIVGEVFSGPDCFVATAAHDDAAAEPVRVLRAYRDERLHRHPAGRAFSAAYYRHGRHGARLLRRHPRLKPLARLALRPLVAYARRRARPRR